MTIAPMHHDVVGNPDGPTLVLVHGFLSSRHQWDLNLERLGESLRLVVVELVGHGASPAPEDAAFYGPEAVAAGFERIREEVGVERWWVCGQSLGAGLSLRYVLAHQQRVHGVIVTNTRAALGRPAHDDPRAEFLALDRRELPFHPIHAKRIPAGLRERMIAAADAVPDHAVVNMLSHRTEWSVVERLDELTVPTLLVNGRFERRFQPLVDDLRHGAPHAEILHLDGGHSVNIAQPAAFDAAVIEFVTRQRR